MSDVNGETQGEAPRSDDRGRACPARLRDEARLAHHAGEVAMTTVLLLTTHLLFGQAVAPIDAEDADKLTQLMRASARGDVTMVESLLAKGADPNTRSSSQNLTALMFAAYHGHEAVVKALLGSGARLDLKDSLGAAAVDWAAFAGHTGLEKVLTGRGAALNPFLNVGTLPVGTMEKAAAKPK